MADQPKQYRDLFEYLLQTVNVGEEENPPKTVDEIICRFVDGCRDKLRENQPVSTDFGQGVLSLRLQDSTYLPLVDGAVRTTGGDEGSQPVTQHKPGFGINRGGIQGAPSFGITGRQ